MRRLIASFAVTFGVVLVACSDDGNQPLLEPDVAAPSTIHPMNARALEADGQREGLVPAAAMITNGTVTLGVNDEGHLVTGGVGLTFNPTSGEALAPGCACEGWGVADVGTAVSGGESESLSHPGNLTIESFTSDASTAVSVVTVGTTFRVTHDFHPSTTPALYEVTVTIENISGAALTDVRYRRVMDWDVPPTEFNEFVTIQGSAGAANLINSSDDGFQSVDPLVAFQSINFFGDAVDNGPNDHGAAFDFTFGSLAPGASTTFDIYYGAASNENSADAALGTVDAELFSYGQPNTVDGPTLGTPNTFIFAFAGVGGDPVFGGGGEEPVAGACPVDAGANTITPQRFGPISIWIGTGAADVAVGGNGPDIFILKGGPDIACGGGGNDFFNGGFGDDVWFGGSGVDAAFGMQGSDQLHGEGGRDRNDGGHTGPTNQVDEDSDTCGEPEDQNFLCEVILGEDA